MLVIEKSQYKSLPEISPSKKLTDTYGIVLAGGSGRRMEEFILQYYGCRNPKQYVDFTGEGTMIQQTLRRTQTLIPQNNILVVADPKHESLVENQLRGHPSDRVIFQPSNRETAPGVLLPLAHIYKDNPDSTVAIFPADHFVLEEDLFMDHVRLAAKAVEQLPEQIILLGIHPDAPETEYGWIQPGKRVLNVEGMEISQVNVFLEKPEPEIARHLYRKGYLWNTLIIVARCSTLWNLTLEALPGMRPSFEAILKGIGTFQEKEIIHREYETMGKATISHSVFEKYSSRLHVAKVNRVFWSDWGNGPRVLATLDKIGRPANPLQEKVTLNH
ncbi:MAG: NTP transferase domain-containing protein [Nitrospirae bacterium]|nr:NTP transferase domain-containing protein [Nitrospirota bacterium]